MLRRRSPHSKLPCNASARADASANTARAGPSARTRPPAITTQCIGQGGRIAIVSFPEGGNKFPFTTRDLFIRVGSLQGTIQGHSVPRDFLPKLIEWQERGLFPYEKLISTYDFADINKAFSDARAGTVIKPVLLMQE